MMIISTVCALSLTPMLCSQLLRKDVKHGRIYKVLYTPVRKGLDAFDNGYAWLLGWVVGHKLLTVMVCMATFFGSLVLMKSVGTEFFPVADDARL